MPLVPLSALCDEAATGCGTRGEGGRRPPPGDESADAVSDALQPLLRRVEDKTDRLPDEPTTLGEPYSRHLGGKLRELCFEPDGEAVRIPYRLAPGQRIVLLTVFRKTRMREAAEVERAHQTQKVCEAEHGRAEHTCDRRKES